MVRMVCAYNITTYKLHAQQYPYRKEKPSTGYYGNIKIWMYDVIVPQVAHVEANAIIESSQPIN